MSRTMIEGDQPTPEQVAIDALHHTPDHELAEAIPSQTSHDKSIEVALDDMITIFQDALDDIYDRTPDQYTTSELKKNTRILSDAIPLLLGISPDELIPESIETLPDHFVRHAYLLEDNHAWRVAAPNIGTLELRTGPFYDPDLKSSYDPQLKFTLRGTRTETPPKPDGREALVEAVKIINSTARKPLITPQV